jgi:hypothetical protein
VTAFHKYLLSIPRADAIEHVVHCMTQPGGGELAWELLEQAHGKWKITKELGLAGHY